MATFSRREAIGTALGFTALSAHSFAQTAAPGPGRIVKNGRLKQSVSRWCYSRIPMPQFCEAVKEMGLTVTGSTPEQFDAHMRKSLRHFAEIVKAAKVTTE